MNRSRTERISIAATLIAAGLLTWQSTWPDWSRGDVNQERMAELTQKVGDLAQAKIRLQEETARLAAARERQASECRLIPSTADVAGLMQALSLSVDGHVVRDQTFTVTDRPAREVERFDVLPVQIELEADFSSVWSVLERAEALPRLVRVSGLDITMLDRENPVASGSQPLKASMAIDVVYAAADSDRSTQGDTRP